MPPPPQQPGLRDGGLDDNWLLDGHIIAIPLHRPSRSCEPAINEETLPGPPG